MACKMLVKVAVKIETAKAKVETAKAKMARHCYKKVDDHSSDNTSVSSSGKGSSTKHLEKLAKKVAAKARRARRWRSFKDETKEVCKVLTKLIYFLLQVTGYVTWKIILVTFLISSFGG